MKQRSLLTASFCKITTKNKDNIIPNAEPQGPVSRYVGRRNAAIFYAITEVDV